MGLANPKQVEALADSLTSCADSIHGRLMKAIKSKELSLSEAQVIFQDETMLRLRANSLYTDAARCVVSELSVSQKDLMDIVDTAIGKIKQIKKMEAFMDLTADVLTLAAAAYAAKPGPIVAALGEIREDTKNINKLSKP